MISAYGIGERLMTQFPEVEKVMTVSSNLPWGGIEALPITWQDKKINAKIQYTYEDFFDFFSFDLVTGSKSQVLSDKNYAVISDSFAKKFFGDANPIGQTLQISPSISIIVNGIMKDMHNSVIPYCDILARVEKLTEMYPEMDKENYSNCLGLCYYTYFCRNCHIIFRHHQLREPDCRPNRIQSQGSRYPQPVGFYEKRTFYPINPRIYPFKPSILLNRFILGHFSHSIRKSIVRGSY